jgi:hypothetical protein
VSVILRANSAREARPRRDIAKVTTIGMSSRGAIVAGTASTPTEQGPDPQRLRSSFEPAWEMLGPRRRVAPR